MKSNWDQCFSLILREEGGYSDNPNDPGGITNLGVTKLVWEKWVGHPVTASDMAELTPDLVKPLYHDRYWNAIKGDNLPNGVDYTIIDFAVNSGPSKAIKSMQAVLQVDIDGVIGPKTFAAINLTDPLYLCEKINDNRLQFLQSLPTWKFFGNGWSARVGRVMKASERMIKD